jgi:hypothetical protein
VARSPAGTTAVNCVALTNVVVSATPFHSTTVPAMKLLPVSIRVNDAPPAVAEFGVREPNVGTGFGPVTVNVCPAEVPPPGVGLKTVTEAVPAVAISEAGTAAVNWVALTNVVVKATPFHCTTEPATKFVPAIVRVKAGPPAVAVVGEIKPEVGTGLSIVNERGLDVPPPGVGVKTVTEAVPRWQGRRPEPQRSTACHLLRW